MIRRMVALAMVVAAVGVTLAMWRHLPARIPIHWNLRGDVDGYAPKGLSLFVNPLIMVAMFALFESLPRLSPRGYGVAADSRAVGAMELATLAFLLVMQCAIVAAASEAHVRMSVLAPLLVGLLLIVIGNYLGKVSRNFFIGIRTPWTLANEEVWFRTHRIGGKLFVVAGIVIAALAPFAGRGAGVVILVAALGATAATIVYSYVIYRRIAAGEG